MTASWTYGWPGKQSSPEKRRSTCGAFWTEATLRRVVGGPKVMHEQLDLLLKVTEEHKHVDIQVLPFDVGAHAGIDGSFQLLSFQVGSPVAVVEAKTTSVYLAEDVAVDRYRSAFDDLRQQAIDPQASRRYSQE